MGNISNFKSSDINYRIALCDPERNGMRYLKTLIYILASKLSKESKQILLNIKNRNVGNPISVKYDNIEICLDYLQTTMELSFIKNNMNVKDLNILEIGAGYGRLCHALFSNFPVKSYTIVELKNYELIKEYLKEVLDKRDFKKIRFFKYPDIPLENFDLVINIDSFGEIESIVVKNYLEVIDNYCKYFYTKNTVGKYYDKTLDNHWKGTVVVDEALKMGLMQEIIDVFNENDIKRKGNDFIKQYCPSSKWNCIANSWAEFWPHYWQCLYKKVRNNGT